MMQKPTASIALIVSLCVNLLLAGVIATAAVRFFHHPPLPPGPFSLQPPERAQLRQLLSPRFLSHMAPEQGEKIRAIVDAHRATLDRLKSEANAGRREVLMRFAAPNVDKDGLVKALARTQIADAAVETEVMRICAEIAPILTPEQRKKAADWRGHHAWVGGWHPDRDDRPRDRE